MKLKTRMLQWKRRYERWSFRSDPYMAKYVMKKHYHYSAGMEPGTWDEKQQVAGTRRQRERELARFVISGFASREEKNES